MSDFDLNQDSNHGLQPKESKEPSTESEAHDSGNVAKAIEHGRPDALGAKGAMHLQRMAGNAAMGALVQRQEDDAPVQSVVRSGGGDALDAGVRSKMESSLGYDFSGVKVHTGGDAAKAAKSVQAQAFTVGNNVVFNEGKYSPGTPEGQRTIAHELTHVVQQSKGDVPGTPQAGGVKVSDPSDWAEQEAEATADAVMSSGDDHAGHDHAGDAGASVQTLADDSVQREGEEASEVEEEEEPEATQELAESVQREGEEELEGEGEE